MLIQIKDATPTDISILSDLIRNSFRDVALRFNLTIKNAPTHPSNCNDEWIKSDFEKGKRFFILKKERVPCGCVAIEKANNEIYYLERLGILPEYRNNGFGTFLLEHAKNKSRENGAKMIEIGIIGENIELKEWYLKRGFIFRENKLYNHLPFTVSFMYYDFS